MFRSPELLALGLSVTVCCILEHSLGHVVPAIGGYARKMSIMRRLVSALAKKKAKEVDHILNHPIELTEDKLMSVLSNHKDTVFGRKYGFESIRNSEQYMSKVPLFDYHDMEPYLKMVYENPNGHILTADPVIWYLKTSGTTGKPKHIPLTQSGAKDTSKGTMLTWLAFVNANPENAKIFDGTLVVLGAPAEIDHINGIPLGYATGAMIRRFNPLFKRLMKPGEDVFNITDMDEKMRRYASLLAETNVTGLLGISTLLLALVRRMQNQYGPWLLENLRGTGQEHRIQRLMYDDGKLDVQGLWPNLRLLTTSGIDCDPYREWIKKTLPTAQILDMYAGSEGFYGGQFFEEPGIQLVPHLNFFEFIPENEVQSPNPTVIPLAEVKKGSRYEMVLTNNGGFYRYRLGDMMTFTDTDPYTIRSIGRRGRVVNMSGEKLSDKHVANAMAAASSRTGAQVTDYCMVGMVENGVPHYTLALMLGNDGIDVVEFVMALEEALMADSEEFRIVRESGALGPTTVTRMKTSYFEKVVQTTHIQAKPMTLTTDTQVLAMCEP